MVAAFVGVLLVLVAVLTSVVAVLSVLVLPPMPPRPPPPLQPPPASAITTTTSASATTTTTFATTNPNSYQPIIKMNENDASTASIHFDPEGANVLNMSRLWCCYCQTERLFSRADSRIRHKTHSCQSRGCEKTRVDVSKIPLPTIKNAN